MYPDLAGELFVIGKIRPDGSSYSDHRGRQTDVN